MKNRTWLAVLLLAAVLGASVYVPVALSGYEEKKLLADVQTEQLKESAKPEKPSSDTLEKLSVINRARQTGSEVISGKVVYSAADNRPAELVEKGFKKLLQSGILTGEGLTGSISIKEAMRMYYTEADAKMYYTEADANQKIRCFYIVAECSGLFFSLLIDEETEALYEISISSSDTGADIRLTDNVGEKWAEYLGITLKEMDRQPLDGVSIYETGDSDVLYIIYQSEQKDGGYISLTDTLSLGLEGDHAASTVDDATSTGDSRAIDATW
ncbi:hypothetical protein [Dorea sp. D27]|uniref:hypothetical protein n=1 Tax=Dorea sp. D27 TaxID=658665 RepID=UPI000673BF1D|nr:hypothetical protein [Dorea sp. D27]KMZ55574.1 hypothetical protein HMPREF0980_00272 [Dorea sp. D27]